MGSSCSFSRSSDGAKIGVDVGFEGHAVKKFVDFAAVTKSDCFLYAILKLYLLN